MARLNVLRTDDMIGRPVGDPRGASLGRVEDVIFDADSGRIAYVLLSLDLGFGDDRLFPVPWQALTSRPGGSELVLDVPLERLREAPSLRRNELPGLSEPAVGESVYRFYNREPFWDRRTSMESPRYAASGYARSEAERYASRGSSGAAGLLAAVILLLLALGIIFYTLYPKETRVAAENVGEAAEEAAVAVVDTSEDAASTARVKTALALSKTVSVLEIDVDSDEGVVTLTGRVPSDEAKLIAVAIAEDTSGVDRVVDRLTVSSEAARSGTRESLANRVSDVETRVKVQEAIRNSSELEGQVIEVAVKNGVATLTGDVDTTAQRARAEEIAREAEGVREVVNQIESRGPTL
ncbi:MAG: BON domain-containing protein [Vicinamibacteria bacterium]